MNGPSRHRSAGVIAGVALLAMGGPGLAGHGADKTGSDTVVLHLATIDGSVNANGQEYGPQAFVDSLDSVSGGRLQVDVSTVLRRRGGRRRVETGRGHRVRRPRRRLALDPGLCRRRHRRAARRSKPR